MRDNGEYIEGCGGVVEGRIKKSVGVKVEYRKDIGGKVDGKEMKKDCGGEDISSRLLI